MVISSRAGTGLNLMLAKLRQALTNTAIATLFAVDVFLVYLLIAGTVGITIGETAYLVKRTKGDATNWPATDHRHLMRDTTAMAKP